MPEHPERVDKGGTRRRRGHVIKKALIAVAGVVLAFGGISAAHALGHTTTPPQRDASPATTLTDITFNPATTVGDDQGDQNEQGDNNDQADSETSSDQGDQNDQGDSETSSDHGVQNDQGDVGDSVSGDQGDQNDQGDTESSSDQADQNDHADERDSVSGDQGDQGDQGD
jgi:hypothetical protein